MDQNKTNKSWCDQHKYNKSHVTENCYFLNKQKTKEINQVEAADDTSETEGAVGFYDEFQSFGFYDKFQSADDSSDTEGQY